MNPAPVILLAILLGSALCRAQECSPFWRSTVLPPGSPTINRLAVYDDGSGEALYLAGTFYTFPAYSDSVWRYRGESWEPVGPGQLVGYGRDLLVHDAGNGPELFSYGNGPNGIPVHNLAKWNGQQWSPVGPGGGGNAHDMQPFNDPRGSSLFIGGTFTNIGGGQSRGLAQWVGCPNCYVNCDNSTTAPTLNIADFSCFLQKFARNDPYANCDLSSEAPAINIADFACFVQKFAAGCP